MSNYFDTVMLTSCVKDCPYNINMLITALTLVSLILTRKDVGRKCLFILEIKQYLMFPTEIELELGIGNVSISN